MVTLKEKEFFIGMMVIDMKVIIKMVSMKEKEFFIMLMMIGKLAVI